MTSASDGTATADRSAREAIIRDLYAIAAFYVANPEHPLPRSIVVYHYVPAAEVELIAAAYAGGHTYGDEMQCHHDLAGTSVNVTMLVSEPTTTGKDRPL